MITLPIAKLKQDLPSLANKVRKGENKIIVLENDKTATLMSQDEYESWKETMEIMSDPDSSLEDDILEGIKEMKSGKKPKNTINLTALKKELKL